MIRLGMPCSGSLSRLKNTRVLLSTTSRQYSAKQSSQGIFPKGSWQRLLAWYTLISSGALATFIVGAGALPSENLFELYQLDKKLQYSSTSAIFTFAEIPHRSYLRQYLKPIWQLFRSRALEADWTAAWENGIWSLEFKQPQLQIAREYTPLPPDLVGNPETKLFTHPNPGFEPLQFWIRREPSGEVSNYIHKLETGSRVELRKPISKVQIPEAQEFLFLAGGTGIVPALQLAHYLLAKHEADPKSTLPSVKILWANRSREDCLGGSSDDASSSSKSTPWSFVHSKGRSSHTTEISPLVERLDRLKTAFEGKLQVDYYVDEEHTLITKQDIMSRLHCSQSDSGAKRVVMVCGPDGFVTHFAGGIEWLGGQRIQGASGGILRDAHKLGWQVIKL